MIFEFKNLGSIKEAQIEMGKLTVICGKNNTGKTYLTYAVWGFLSGILFEDFNDFNIQFNPNAFPLSKINSDELYDELLNNNYALVKIADIEDDVASIMTNLYIQLFHINCYEIFNSHHDYFKDLVVKLRDLNFTEDFYNDINESVIEYENNIILEYDTVKKGYKLYSKNNNITIQKKIFEKFLQSVLFSIINNVYLGRVVVFPTERGVSRLFQKELDTVRNELIKREQFNLLERNKSRFSLPVQESIDIARKTDEIIKENSFLYQKEYQHIINYLEEDMLNINYQVVNGELTAIDSKSKVLIPHYMASTSVRSLADLHLWLKHSAQKGNLLMIDEPELNLHPENQIKMARLFAKLVNAGIRVWITTHSDYIVKELNNCIMLGNVSNRIEILEKYKGEYSENDILKAEDLKAYIAYNLPDGGSTVRKIEIDKYGMVESTFDETIDKMNEISQTFADNID